MCHVSLRDILDASDFQKTTGVKGDCCNAINTSGLPNTVFASVTCLDAASSSRPSPTTTYVHFRPNRDTIRSKQLSLPAMVQKLTNIFGHSQK